MAEARKKPARDASSKERRQPKRRKDERPDEIVSAALEEFAAKGYAATRLEDVASRAGVSKGLPYLYFKTKEELFKAVIKAVLKPGFDALIAEIEQTPLSSEEFLRGPFASFLKSFVRSRRAKVAQLLVAEGPKHPELTAYYMENVITHGIEAMRLLIDRGVERGEFRETGLREFPQLLVAPALLAVLWRALFERHRPLDTDKLLDTHITLMLDAIRAPRNTPGAMEPPR
jgi:AcrR family transcriptional regulator